MKETLPMSEPKLIKNMTFSKPLVLEELVQYAEGQIVSRTLAQNPTLSLTVFAFDKGEEVSTHTSPGDAMVQVVDGEALITIDGEEMVARKGEVVVMPSNVPHAVAAQERFKMVLTVVKPQKV